MTGRGAEGNDTGTGGRRVGERREMGRGAEGDGERRGGRAEGSETRRAGRALEEERSEGFGLGRLVTGTRGVPQGSVLGAPLSSPTPETYRLAVTSPTMSIQFADDIALTSRHRSADLVSSELTTAVSSLARWLASGGLILNATTSQLLVFAGSDGF